MSILFGDVGNDNLQGGAGIDLLVGFEGDDTITGGDQTDFLIGNQGNDILQGDLGDDFMFGGQGNDRMIWNNGDGSDLMEGGNDQDTVEVNGAANLGNDFLLEANGERAKFQRLNLGLFELDIDDTEQAEINGGVGDDTLTVNDLTGTDIQTVIFNGGDGNDILNASNANVSIIADGGAGDDLLIGSIADDQLLGGDGNDTLIGNGGNDLLIGGAGNDLLVAQTDSDISTFITVESFDTSADVLQLEGVASNYVTNATSEGTGIYIDADGSGSYSEGIDELAVRIAEPIPFSLEADYVNYV